MPWKNLYTAPVIANLDGLYIIVAPNAGKEGIVYASVLSISLLKTKYVYDVDVLSIFKSGYFESQLLFIVILQDIHLTYLIFNILQYCLNILQCLPYISADCIDYFVFPSPYLGFLFVIHY